MKYLGETAITVEMSERGEMNYENIPDNCDIVYKHLALSFELDLKAAPIGMTIVHPDGTSTFYKGKNECLKLIRGWKLDVGWPRNNLDIIHLHYFTYTEVHTPFEHLQKHTRGFIPNNWNKLHEENNSKRQ